MIARRLDPSEAARIAAQYGAIVRVRAVTVCPPMTFAVDMSGDRNWMVQSAEKAKTKARQREMEALRKREAKAAKQPTKAEMTAFQVAMTREEIRRAAKDRKNAARRAKRLAERNGKPMRAAAKRTNYRLDDYVDQWLALVTGGMSHRAAAAQLGLNKSSAGELARKLTKRGVTVPNHCGNRNPRKP